MKRISAAILAALLAAGAAATAPQVRLAYNYCTLSYTFAYYSDAEWEAEADRLAAAGFNTALVTDGTFKVWQLTLRECGYCDDAIAKFIPDECARAWWLMGNLTGEGGPIDNATIDADGERGRRIAALMRSRGIEPVLHGFMGMMPLGHPGAIPQGRWSCYERPPLLDPTKPEYARLATIWHKNLERVYGFKPKYLAGDLFHEGGNTASIDVTAATRAVQAAQQAAFPGVVWIVQAWQENPTTAVRAGLDPRHTLIEALVKDMGVYARDGEAVTGFGNLPWIWCEVLNFGGNHGLYGNLRTFARLGRAAKGRAAATFRGYGALSEGFFTNEVCSDLFEPMMMQPAGEEMDDATLESWLRDWVARRYASNDERIFAAWKILADTVYSCARPQEGTVENVMCAEPAWDVTSVSTWGPRGGLWYRPDRLATALALMEAAAEEAEATPKLRQDIADVKRQIIANRARALVPSLRTDAAARKEFLSLFPALAAAVEGVDAFSLEREETRARNRAGERGVAAFRRMVTTWTSPSLAPNSLCDYANREYGRLVLEYYLPRWKKFLSPES